MYVDVPVAGGALIFEPTTISLQSNDPDPVTVHNEFDAVCLKRVTVNLTLRVIPELIVRVAVVPVKNMSRQLAAAVTVMVCPFSIYTSSLFPGIVVPGDPPGVDDHVDAEFQLPETME